MLKSKCLEFSLGVNYINLIFFHIPWIYNTIYVIIKFVVFFV